jgi:hypothetical protein
MKNPRPFRLAMFSALVLWHFVSCVSKCVAQGGGAIIAGPGAMVVVLGVQAPAAKAIQTTIQKPGGGNAPSAIPVKVQMRADYNVKAKAGKEGEAWSPASLNGNPALLKFTKGALAIKTENLILIIFDDFDKEEDAEKATATVIYSSDDGKELRMVRGVPQPLNHLGLGIDKAKGSISLLGAADVKAISFK